MKRIFGVGWVGLLALGFVLNWTPVCADGFYVIPVKPQFQSWHKKIENPSRFALVLDNQAVLDKETGLVWEKTPDTSTTTWAKASKHCYQREVGNRKGWRLPTIEELASLIDNDVEGDPKLPEGHLFIDVQSAYYWSSTTSKADNGNAWYVLFSDGSLNDASKDAAGFYMWCVRAGYGYDGH